MQKNNVSKEFLFAKEVPVENVGVGVNRQIMGYDNSLMLVKVNFDKNSIGPLHEHHHSQVSYVVSGKFEVTIGDKKKILQKGDSFYIPPYVRHGAICLEAGTLIDTFSPIREDFIK